MNESTLTLLGILIAIGFVSVTCVLLACLCILTDIREGIMKNNDRQGNTE